MKELNELVQAKLNEMAKSGAIEKLVSDQVEKLVSDALSDTFTSYSPLSKSLKENLKKGLDVNFEKIDYPSYNAIMLSAVQGHIDKYFGKQMHKDLHEQIETLLSVPPKEMSLANLADNIVKIVRDSFSDEEDYLSSISFDFSDRSFGSTLEVTWDENGDKQSLASIYLGCDRISTIRLNHRHKQSYNPTFVHGAKDVVSAYVFKLYAAKTVITGLEDFDADDHYSEARCED